MSNLGKVTEYYVCDKCGRHFSSKIGTGATGGHICTCGALCKMKTARAE